MKGFKTILFSLMTAIFLLSSTPDVQAQFSGNRDAISISGTWVDYYSLFTDDFLNLDFDATAIKLGYHRSLVNDVLNLEVPFQIGGARVPYNRAVPNRVPSDVSDRKFKASLGGLLQLQLFKESHKVVPYLSAGVVGSYVSDEGKWHAEIPLGIGFDFKVSDRGYFQVRPEYRLGLVDDNRNNLNLHVGFKYFLGEGGPKVDKDRDKDGVLNEMDDCPDVPGLAGLKGCPDGDGDGIADKDDACPTVAGLVGMKGCPDTDGDGIADKDDACPEIAGMAKFNGCADSDNDGLADNNDKCPNEAGPATNAGCPYGDSDGDGVNDNNDSCPNQAGLPKFNGCPDSDNDGIADNEDSCPNQKGTAAMKGCPDSDKDGIADNQDKCPNKAGPASNNGCPVAKVVEKEVQEAISFAAKNVQFETNSNRIKAISYKEMDNVASILKQYPDYSVSISGHTDSQGNADYNQKLSERRAKACLDYLVTKGVSASRMNSAGYGETQPIADNATNAGRQMNRRVEFSLFRR